MTVRTITHVDWPCGHRGSIVESKHDDSRSHWFLATMRGLSHSGQYDELDRLFAETTPACPVCGLSLSPDHLASEGNATSDLVAHITIVNRNGG
jgi:hypothetical protein